MFYALHLNSENRLLVLPYGIYKIGAKLYSINALGVFYTTQFETRCISRLDDMSTGERAVCEIELRAIERTIAG